MPIELQAKIAVNELLIREWMKFYEDLYNGFDNFLEITGTGNLIIGVIDIHTDIIDVIDKIIFRDEKPKEIGDPDSDKPSEPQNQEENPGKSDNQSGPKKGKRRPPSRMRDPQDALENLEEIEKEKRKSDVKRRNWARNPDEDDKLQDVDDIPIIGDIKNHLGGLGMQLIILENKGKI